MEIVIGGIFGILFAIFLMGKVESCEARWQAQARIECNKQLIECEKDGSPMACKLLLRQQGCKSEQK